MSLKERIIRSKIARLTRPSAATELTAKRFCGRAVLGPIAATCPTRLTGGHGGRGTPLPHATQMRRILRRNNLNLGSKTTPIQRLEAELARAVAQAPPAGTTREGIEAPLELLPRRPLTEADVEPHGHPSAAPFSKLEGDTLNEEPTAKAVGSSRRVEDFQTLKAAVHIRSRKWGDIWLVQERTGAPRFEILPEEIRLLSLAGAVFGAKVVEVRRNVPA